MRHLTYLALLLGCLAVTIPLERAFGTRVLRRLGTFLLVLLPVLVVFLAWDLYAISRGQWSYDARYLTGIRLPGRLPLEEALFFVVIPLAAVLTYEGVRSRLTPEQPAPADEPSAERADR